MTNETISALDNPTLAQQLVQAAISMPTEQEESSPVIEETVTIAAPPASGHVQLLAGLYNSFTGELTDTAEIRELNGVDEEALSRINDYGRTLLSILERGTVKIGDKPATKELLDKLLSGDREYLILQIRLATFGPEIELTGPCPSCEVEQTFTVDLENDVKIDKLEDSTSGRTFVVKGKVGEITVEFPNGEVQRKLITSTNKTSAELDSILLKECVIMINGNTIVDPEQIKSLSMGDRREIIKELGKKNPGPDLSSIKKTCTSCGSEVPTPLSLADIFRI
jgi:hypothetical protein